MLTWKVKTQYENLMELSYKIEEMLQASSIKYMVHRQPKERRLLFVGQSFSLSSQLNIWYNGATRKRQRNCVNLKWITLNTYARLDLRCNMKEGFLQGGGEEGRHVVWLRKGAWQADGDRNSCRGMGKKGRLFICLLCPSDFRKDLGGSPEKYTGTTHLKYGIRAHLAGSVLRVSWLAPSLNPTYSAIRNEGKINLKRICVWSKINEANSITLDVYWTQSLNKFNH